MGSASNSTAVQNGWEVEQSATTKKKDEGLVVEEGGGEAAHVNVRGNDSGSNEKSEIAQQVEQQVEDPDRGMLAGWAPWRMDRWKLKRLTARTDGEILENVGSNDDLLPEEEGGNGADGEVVWRVYKRRWFGLGQLVLLNIVVSWDVSIYTISPLCDRAGRCQAPSLGLASRKKRLWLAEVVSTNGHPTAHTSRASRLTLCI